MAVYWRHAKNGQNLMFSAEDDGNEERIGGYRETKRGIDAYAATFGYEPGRSQKGFATIEEAKSFVESFQPWELYGVQDVSVDHEVRPALDVGPASPSGPPPQSASNDSSNQAESAAAPAQPVEIAQPTNEKGTGAVERPAGPQTKRKWWEFWKA